MKINSKPMLPIEQPLTTTAVGKRIKLLRGILGLNIREFAEFCGVSRQTMGYWEEDGGRNITPKNVAKILNAASKLGYSVTSAWLLYGIGEEPPLKPNILYSADTPIADIKIDSSSLSKPTIDQEIDLFISQNKNSVVTAITDTSMAPAFEKGDRVGGIWLPMTTNNILEKNCIIKINNHLQIRKVKNISPERLFTLSYLSYDHATNEPFELKNITPSAIAPIIRVWRYFN